MSVTVLMLLFPFLLPYGWMAAHSDAPTLRPPRSWPSQCIWPGDLNSPGVLV